MSEICLITANLGGFDNVCDHKKQSVDYDYHLITDKEFPPRCKAMTSRMQARIPKCFAWQFAPGYNYYMWIDGNLSLCHEDSLKYFYDNLKGYDLVVLRHKNRPNIRQETRYLRKGIKQESKYIIARYEGELYDELYNAVRKDKDYIDDVLFQSGIFMYKDSPQVRDAMEGWWYQISRYHIVDQTGFPYAMKKANLKIKILEDIYDHCWFLKVQKHKHHLK
jgi:hypothetical protein